MDNPGNGKRTDGISKKATYPPGQQSPLAMDAATFRAVGHRLVDQLAELLESVPRRPVTHDESPAAVRDALGEDLRRHKENPICPTQAARR